MSRYALTEAWEVTGRFLPGDTVTMALYDRSDGSTVALSSASCAEIGSTGLFRFASSQITTAPTAFTRYTWQMTAGSGATDQGEVEWGGWADELIVLEKLLTNDATVVDIGGGVNQVTIFDDDGTTILRRMNVSADGLTRTVIVGD